MPRQSRNCGSTSATNENLFSSPVVRAPVQQVASRVLPSCRQVADLRALASHHLAFCCKGISKFFFLARIMKCRFSSSVRSSFAPQIRVKSTIYDCETIAWDRAPKHLHEGLLTLVSPPGSRLQLTRDGSVDSIDLSQLPVGSEDIQHHLVRFARRVCRSVRSWHRNPGRGDGYHRCQRAVALCIRWFHPARADDQLLFKEPHNRL